MARKWIKTALITAATVVALVLLIVVILAYNYLAPGASAVPQPLTVGAEAAHNGLPPYTGQSRAPSQPTAQPPAGRPTEQPAGRPTEQPAGRSTEPPEGLPAPPTAQPYDGTPSERPAEAMGAPRPGKVAYITIDDGPSRAITPGILDVLKAEGIKATFFVLAHRNVDDIYQRIIDEGHEIGNHTFTHNRQTVYDAYDLNAFRQEVLSAQAFIYDNFGYTMTTFRFPGGAMGRSASIIEPRREDFDWHVDSGDAHPRQTDRSAATLTNNVLLNTRGREQLIVLFHDTSSKGTTLEALPRVIAGLREQGYTFDIMRNYSFQGS
jgi:peptidoglycan/xylan/chitin deacetylase (PgdA/CDA1 family)